MAANAPADERTNSESLVDRDSHFDGLYKTQQNLKVEGKAEGEIQCEGTLTVEQGARVKAKVTARNVTVAGDLEGEVICQDVFKIMPTGQVEATVAAGRLIVEEGGFYNGEFVMTKNGDAGRLPQPSLRTPDDDWRSYLADVETSPASDDEAEPG
ncbi:MAG: polymer-forming cytoskeletal protein [Caldilineales bacterium]